MQYKFYDSIQTILDKIRETQSAVIREVAGKISKILSEGGVLFTFGTGHSHMLAEEIYARAGGLYQVKGLLEPEYMLHQAHGKSTMLERLPGLAKVVLDINMVREKDALIIISNSGRNSVPVEMAIEAKKRGMFVVALTNMEHSKAVESRDPSGKKLYEVVDYVFDNCGVPGDAILEVEGMPYRVSPTSTIAGGIILQALVAEIVEELIQSGGEATVMMSGNLDGSDEYNKLQITKLIEKYPELALILK